MSEPDFVGIVGVDGHSRSDVRVYPQPATGTLHVSGVTNGKAYRLLDARGWVVVRGILHSANSSIDIRSLDPGMHVLELSGDDAQRVPVVVE